MKRITIRVDGERSYTVQMAEGSYKGVPIKMLKLSKTKGRKGGTVLPASKKDCEALADSIVTHSDDRPVVLVALLQMQGS